MVSKDEKQKMKDRKKYKNKWQTSLMKSMLADTPFCCFAFFCAPCASYLLRKRALEALGGDMTSYRCCGGFEPCSGRCGEKRCPEFCLATETQHKVEMDYRDRMTENQRGMAVPPNQQMSRIKQSIPSSVGYAPQAPPATDNPVEQEAPPQP